MHARNCFHSYASDVMQAINRVRTFTFLSLILQGSLWWDTKQCSNSCLRKEITSHNHCPSHVISLTTHQASHERAWGVGLHFITFRPTHENHQLASIWWVDLMKSSFQDFPIVILGISKDPVNLGKLMNCGFRAAHVLISPHFVHLMRITSSPQFHGWIPWVPCILDFLHYHSWHLQRASEFGETHEWGLLEVAYVYWWVTTIISRHILSISCHACEFQASHESLILQSSFTSCRVS